MAIKTFEIPKKKRINRRALEAKINEYIDATSFTIQVSDDEERPSEIHFKTFYSPLDIGVFMNRIIATSIQDDPLTKTKVLDEASFRLGLHMFIFQILSTMPEVRTNDGEDGDIDVARTGIYGTYFYKTSQQYRDLYDEIYYEIKPLVEDRVATFQEIQFRMADNFDITKLLTSPEMMELYRDEFGSGKDKPDEDNKE